MLIIATENLSILKKKKERKNSKQLLNINRKQANLIYQFYQDI